MRSRWLTTAALTDTDHDGMPSAWEKASYLHPQDAADRALQAFAVNALDYLLKPVQETRLAAALAKARARIVAPVPAETGPTSSAEEAP